MRPKQKIQLYPEGVLQAFAHEYASHGKDWRVQYWFQDGWGGYHLWKLQNFRVVSGICGDIEFRGYRICYGHVGAYQPIWEKLFDKPYIVDWGDEIWVDSSQLCFKDAEFSAGVLFNAKRKVTFRSIDAPWV